MDKIYEIILRKNFPHVATILNKNYETEELEFNSPLNILELLQGVAELNKNGIVITKIKAGVSKEGTTKIIVEDNGTVGLFINDEWVLEPSNTDEIDLPEVNNTIIPFKSDSWILGEFIVRYITGKGIPKKFLKSQTLLDKFSNETYKAIELDKLLVLDPSKRSYTWDLVPKSEGCSVM